MEDLTKEFIAESHEGLERMDLCLTELEKRPDDGELVREIFRTVHTIKGTTGFLGFRRLEKLAHAGEGLLGALRDGKLAVTTELINGLLQLMDGLRTILQRIESAGTEGKLLAEDDGELIAHLEELKAGAFPASGDTASQNRDVGHPNPSSEQVVKQTDCETVDSKALTSSSARDKTLHIDVEVLNRMMNQVGELVLTRNQILLCRRARTAFPSWRAGSIA